MNITNTTSTFNEKNNNTSIINIFNNNINNNTKTKYFKCRNFFKFIKKKVVNNCKKINNQKKKLYT